MPRGRQFVKDREAEFRLAASTLECVLPARGVTFVAGPVSSGRRLIRLLRKFDVRSQPALIERIGNEEYHSLVVQPNIREGLRFATKLRRAGERCVVCTGPLYHPAWYFEDYMRICTLLLREKCSKVYFINGWEYSRGSVIELETALAHNLHLHAADGSRLSLVAARQLLTQAQTSLARLGAAVDAWEECLHALT